jgi:hypothetical protein
MLRRSQLWCGSLDQQKRKRRQRKRRPEKQPKSGNPSKLKVGTSSPKPRVARKTAAKLHPSASATPEIAKTELQSAPLKEVTTTATPVVAPPLQNKITVDTHIETKPLPRSAAVTAYRKNGPLDALAYWLRSSARSLTTLFKRAKPAPIAKTPISEVDRLRDENLALQRRIETLLAAQNKTDQ